jgi:flagellin
VLMGFTVGQTSATTIGNNDSVQVQFTGAGMTSPVTLKLATFVSGTTTAASAVADLTSQVANNSALSAAGISVTSSASGNNLVLTDNKGEKFQVAVTGDSTNVLGFGSFSAGSTGSTFDYSTITGASTLPTAPQANIASTGSLNISLNGGATASAINVALKSTLGTVSGTAVTDAAVTAAALVATDKIGFLVNGVQKTVTFAGGETTLASLATEINTAAQGATADVVGSGANQSLRLTATGTGSTITVTAAVSTGPGLAATGLVAGQSGTGLANAAAVQADAVSQINAAVAGNSALSGAGIQASIVSNKLVLTSTNGTNFRANGSGATDLGFGISGGSYAGTTNSAAPTAGRVDSAGAYTSTSMAFTAVASGSDSQTVSITATDASGGSHSQAIVIQNNATARTGDTIDDTIHAINTALQQSNDATLQSVYAVKEDNSNGTESIKFQSTTQNFKVAVSALADGTGITAPTGGISTATQNGAGSTADISTQAGANAAVNALATAVQNLGTAQAAIGKGENLLNYAVGLAQSQSTNEAAAESQIRDANLAQAAANLTKAQILVQAGTAALAQANSAPQAILSLLK